MSFHEYHTMPSGPRIFRFLMEYRPPCGAERRMGNTRRCQKIDHSNTTATRWEGHAKLDIFQVLPEEVASQAT